MRISVHNTLDSNGVRSINSYITQEGLDYSRTFG